MSEPADSINRAFQQLAAERMRAEGEIMECIRTNLGILKDTTGLSADGVYVDLRSDESIGLEPVVKVVGVRITMDV